MSTCYIKHGRVFECVKSFNTAYALDSVSSQNFYHVRLHD